jgi:hypothetical protein
MRLEAKKYLLDVQQGRRAGLGIRRGPNVNIDQPATTETQIHSRTVC